MLTPVLRRFFPFLNWPRPNRQTLGRDCWAGITVGLVLIPQALAYATLAGMPAHTGLYAALLPSVVGVLWGSSALLAVGPVALTSLLVYGALSPIAQPGSPQWVALAIWLALYAGIMQFLLGAFRGGRIASLVSTPVMVGFINAAAVIIIFSQLPALLGMELSPGGSAGIMERLRNAAAIPIVPVFGCTAIALLLALRRFLPRLPGILIVTIGSIAVSTMVGYSSAGGNVVGDVPSGLPPLAIPPAISLDSHRHLLPAALIIALISFTEAMSSCRVLARKTNEQWDENQELLGQGLAKVTAAFSGTFAVSGSFSRSALNLYSGAVRVFVPPAQIGTGRDHYRTGTDAAGPERIPTAVCCQSVRWRDRRRHLPGYLAGTAPPILGCRRRRLPQRGGPLLPEMPQPLNRSSIRT